jgi:hypothetical protein
VVSHVFHIRDPDRAPPPACEAITTVGDLQGGIEEAERVLGFKVIRPDDAER